MVTRRVRRGASTIQAVEVPEAVTPPSSETTALRRRRLPTKAAPIKEQEPAQPIVKKRDPTSSSRVDYDGIIARYKERATSPKNAIRAMCVECMGGMIAEVDRCTSLNCALHPFRKGSNPYHKLSKHNRKDSPEE